MKRFLLIFTIAIFSACANGQLFKSKSIDKGKDGAQIKYPPAGQLIAVKDLQNDLAKLNFLLDSVHPNPSFTMNVVEVKLQLKRLSEDLKTPMTQLEAWKYLSLLNPYYQDGHMAVFYPGLASKMNDHINNGGRIFPLKVSIDKYHRLYVTDVENVDEGINVGDEIITINEVEVSKIVKDIVNRMHGDTVSHRLALASQRFANMYWLLNGDTGNYQIDVRDNSEYKRFSILGSNRVIGDVNPEIGHFVKREVLADDIGYLRIDRFYYAAEQEDAYFNFMNETWQVFHDANVRDVIIDVRNNPGGTDHYWQQGIAPYIASEPFLFLSKFKMRMTERNLRLGRMFHLGPDQGELGAIAEGAFDQLIPIKSQNRLRIPGTAYLLMGPLSYSSTILFLTAFQDSKQAVIAGQSSGARSCTTGRIDTSILSGSTLEITLPTAIFTRPSGESFCHRPIKPDIFISDDPTDPAIAVNKLAKSIISNR